MPSRSRERHQNESASTAFRIFSGRREVSKCSGSESVCGMAKNQKNTMRIAKNGELANVCRKKDLKKGCYEIVYSLHISARRMAYGPNIEYPLETLLAGMSKKPKNKRNRVRAVWMPASISARQDAFEERQSRFGAKFADQRLGGLERRQAQLARDTLLVFERASKHADLKEEVYIPRGMFQLTDAQKAGVTYEKYRPNNWSKITRCPRPCKLSEIR